VLNLVLTVNQHAECEGRNCLIIERFVACADNSMYTGSRGSKYVLYFLY
jgi:hypothetical protein